MLNIISALVLDVFGLWCHSQFSIYCRHQVPMIMFSMCSHQVLKFTWFHHVLLNGFVTCSSSSQCVLLIMFPLGSQCVLLIMFPSASQCVLFIMFPSGSQFVHIKFWILRFSPCSSEWVCNLFLKFAKCVAHHVPIRFSICSHQVLNFEVPTMFFWMGL